MIKIAFIGAGSSVFGKRLIIDILSFPALQDCTFTLMDIDRRRLDLMSRLAQKIIDDNEMGQARVETTPTASRPWTALITSSVATGWAASKSACGAT
jgi:alpha-galactosidase